MNCGNQVASWMVSNPRSECSGRGQCLVTSDYLPDYEGWDRSSIGSCDCYDWFTGYNCEFKKCPYGPDPIDYYTSCTYDKELPGSPFIDIYGSTNSNKLEKITNIHFLSIDKSDQQGYTTIKELNDALSSIDSLQGYILFIIINRPFSYYTCTDGAGNKCSELIELGGGNDGKTWKKLSSSSADPFPTAGGSVDTHLRIYFHYYCVEDLRRQTIRPEKESYIRIKATFNNNEKEFGINEGRIPCYECSNQGICDNILGVCKCLGRYTSSNGVDENGNINVGRRGDCSYISPNFYSETEV